MFRLIILLCCMLVSTKAWADRSYDLPAGYKSVLTKTCSVIGTVSYKGSKFDCGYQTEEIQGVVFVVLDNWKYVSRAENRTLIARKGSGASIVPIGDLAAPSGVEIIVDSSGTPFASAFDLKNTSQQYLLYSIYNDSLSSYNYQSSDNNYYRPSIEEVNRSSANFLCRVVVTSALVRSVPGGKITTSYKKDAEFGLSGARLYNNIPWYSIMDNGKIVGWMASTNLTCEDFAA